MALIKCCECGKEFSDKAKICPNCGYPIKKENAKKNRKEFISKQEPKAINGLIIIGIVVSALFILFLLFILINHIYRQGIISKNTGGDISNLVNKVWKREQSDYYETYTFYNNYTVKYYKSGYTFEIGDKKLPSFEQNEKYYYKVIPVGEHLQIQIFDIDFSLGAKNQIKEIETISYFYENNTDTMLYYEHIMTKNSGYFLSNGRKSWYEVKNNTISNTTYTDTTDTTNDINIDKNFKIHVFYRNGCIYCENAFDYLSNNYKEIKVVKHNISNSKEDQLMIKVGKHFGYEEESLGTPFIIINSKAILGYNEGAISSAIENESKKNYEKIVENLMK